ncbi:MAG: manganese efflux pump [Clostridia bacterium]|nr:manganese efflux pump [Clostridia bacterium]
MNYLDIVIIAIGLSMDAFAITIANSINFKGSLNKFQELSMPVAFSLFQGLMPLIGFFIGSLFFNYVAPYAKYFTSAIFFILTIKIIYDTIKERLNKAPEKEKTAKFSLVLILIQALATSIDAFIVGFTLNNATMHFLIAILIISAITFILVYIALLIGKKLGSILGKYTNYVSIIIMLFLAVKNLF